MDTKVFSFPENSGASMLGYLAPLMKQNGLDPNMVFAMMNNRGYGFDGMGSGSWFMWVIVLIALFRNGFGFGGGALAEQVGNARGCDLLSQYIATDNKSALSELSSTLHCDVNAIQSAINSVMASVQSVGNQVGMSSQQVINSIQMGNSAIAAQLAECCCNIRESIASFKGDLQLQFCQQTNALQNSLNGVNTSIERGFSTTAYETAAQTNELKNAIAAQTTLINDKFCQLEMREMQNKIDTLRTENQTLRFAESQQAQNNYLISQLQPVAKPAYLTCSPYQAVQYPYCNPCGNGYNITNNGCNCGCGY